MEQQPEFLFIDGPAPVLQLPDPRAPFYAEVAAAWQLPVGREVQVTLREHDLPHLHGRLELARAPDLPFDPRQPLALRVGAVEFSSRQVAGWSLA
jgi:hypothetical protein